jgi:fructose/tagatose bisphosphate aldolase
MRIDQDLIRRLSEAVPVPLVLHGSSSLDDDQLGAAVGAGMTKINLATHLNRQFTAAVRARLADEPALLDPRPYLRDGRDALADEAARLLAVLGGTRLRVDAETVE